MKKKFLKRNISKIFEILKNILKIILSPWFLLSLIIIVIFGYLWYCVFLPDILPKEENVTFEIKKWDRGDNDRTYYNVICSPNNKKINTLFFTYTYSVYKIGERIKCTLTYSSPTNFTLNVWICNPSQMEFEYACFPVYSNEIKSGVSTASFKIPVRHYPYTILYAAVAENFTCKDIDLTKTVCGNKFGDVSIPTYTKADIKQYKNLFLVYLFMGMFCIFQIFPCVHALKELYKNTRVKKLKE